MIGILGDCDGASGSVEGATPYGFRFIPHTANVEALPELLIEI